LPTTSGEDGGKFKQDLTDFFKPVSPGSLLFDPVVTYDEQAGRFLVAVLDRDDNAQRSFVDFAVSNDSNPLHGFSEMHRLETTETDVGGNRFWGDYPKLGWNADAYVFTLNMFPFAAQEPDPVQIITLAKTSVLDGNPATLTTFRTDRSDRDFTLAAATMHDSKPGDPMWFVEEARFLGGPRADPSTTENAIRLVLMTNVLSSSPVFSEALVDVPVYHPVVAPKQPGGPSPVPFQIDTRVLDAAMRGNLLVAAQNTGSGPGGHALARWYEFDVSGLRPVLVQAGDIDRGPGVDTYYPAIDIAANGDIGISFMESSPSEFMSMYVTGRTPAEPLGVLQTPTLVPQGLGQDTYRGTRAGDYGGISVDPLDQTTFWGANEFAAAGGDWGTAIAHFSLLGAEPGILISHSRAFVVQVYHDLLGRAPDPAGLAFWSALLDQGMSRTQVALAIENSFEFRSNQVQAVYQALLGRPAGPDELASAVAYLSAGGASEQIEANLLASPEYFVTRGGGTNAGFLTALFRDVLGRAIDPVGLIHFAAQLDLGIPRGPVALAVLASVENQLHLVDTFYIRFLGRHADAGGLGLFGGLLIRGVRVKQSIYTNDPSLGVRDEQVAAYLVGSEEYFARV
jgi:hypothetical protein